MELKFIYITEFKAYLTSIKEDLKGVKEFKVVKTYDKGFCDIIVDNKKYCKVSTKSLEVVSDEM